MSSHFVFRLLKVMQDKRVLILINYKNMRVRIKNNLHVPLLLLSIVGIKSLMDRASNITYTSRFRSILNSKDKNVTTTNVEIDFKMTVNAVCSEKDLSMVQLMQPANLESFKNWW